MITDCRTSVVITENKLIKKVSTCIHSWLARCCTARGSSTGLLLVGPTNVKGLQYFYSLKIPFSLKIKNTCFPV